MWREARRGSVPRHAETPCEKGSFDIWVWIIMERIGNAGAGFRFITKNIDTTTSAGRMMTQMAGASAEFGRAMIRELTPAGLAAAWAEGRVGGRRKKLDAAKRRETAESVVSDRKPGAEIARLYNISQSRVSWIAAAHRS